MTASETVAYHARKIINEKGLKCKKIAENAGYTQQTFSNLLNGRKFFGAYDVLKISQALGVTPNELFGFNDSETKETKTA